MVEIKEFAVIFRNELTENGMMKFIPMNLVEGKYDPEYKWFVSTEGITYIHIEDVPENVLGYAYRIGFKFPKESLTEEEFNALKEELMNKIKKFEYIKDPNNDCVIAIDKETGNEYLVENEDDEIIPQKSNDTGKDIELNLTPLELENKVKETIKGQDEAVRKIVTALWTTIKFRNMRKKNMLIIGPSGVGKTAIFEKIKKILNIPVIIFSVPGLSQAGYVGRSTDEILKQVYYDADEDLNVAEKAIIILDEIDKIAARGDSAVSTAGVQNELLKIIEGCTRYIESNFPGEPGFEMDTSKMIFIGTGAFQEIHDNKKTTIGFNAEKTVEKTKIDTEKLINYGLKRELVGRLPIVVELNNLGKEEMKDILLNSDGSELMAAINSLKSLGVEIENIDEVIDYIVEDAIKKHLGARGLILTINNMFQEIFYEVANNSGKYQKVIIGPNIITDRYDFKLVEKKRQVKKLIKEVKG